jgi:hypothetical protein
MANCRGSLVIHRDGSVAYCSEEHTGGRCAGDDRPHDGGVFACRLVEGEACGHCHPASVPATS